MKSKLFGASLGILLMLGPGTPVRAQDPKYALCVEVMRRLDANDLAGVGSLIMRDPKLSESTFSWCDEQVSRPPAMAADEKGDLAWLGATGGVYVGRPGTPGRRIQALDSVRAAAFSPDSSQIALICHRTGADGHPRCVLDLFDLPPAASP